MNIISSQAVVLLLSIAAVVLMVMLVVVCFRQKKLRDSVNAMDRDEVAGCLTEHGFFAHGLASIAGREDMIACIYMTIPQAGYIVSFIAYCDGVHLIRQHSAIHLLTMAIPPVTS